MFTMNVYPGMMTLDCLGLDWDVQPHMEPYAKEYIILCDTDGNAVRCRVNARVTMLKGKGLTKFFARLGTGKFTVTMLKRGKFLVEPGQGKKAPPAAGNSKQRDGKKTAGRGDAGERDAEARRNGAEAQSKGAGARLKTGVPPAKTAGRAKEKIRKIAPGPEKKQPVATERPEHLPRSAAGGKVIPDRVAAEQAGHLPGVVKPGGQSVGQSPGEADQQATVRDTTKNNLVITFFQADDAILLKAAETAAGQAASLADLYLRRQALELSLSPDYGTLLSLSAARDVQPLEYQQQTVRHVLQNLRGRALLCDEVGLGKTVEAGLIMMEYILRGLVRRVLVLAPPSLVEQWREELQSKFNLDFVAYDSHEFKAEPNPWGKFPRIIASLDTAKRDNHRRQVLETEYDMVIVDEAHHLKNSRTKAHQLVSRLKKKYILLLTATPVENDLSELFNLITLLLPGQLETASSFKRKYVTRGNPLKVKNAADLKRLVREVMVRNRRSETGAIAGRRRAEVVEVALSPAEEAFYRRLTTFVRGHYTPGAERPTGGVNRFVLKMLQREAGSSLEALIPTLDKISANQDHPVALRRLCGTLAAQARKIPDRSKADVLVRMLDRINERVVVFTGFRETQRFLAGLLRERGLEVAELHGGMRRLEKEEQVRLFAGGARVLVSTETGSEGRNLQFCRNLINYDLPWNPMRIEQRIGRIHRLGQNRDVYIYNLSASGTIESYILELLDAKINMFQLVVGELDMILGNLKEKKEFEDIVMDIWARCPDETELKREMDQFGEQLAQAREHYRAVKELDDRLLGELLPDEQ
ncbi:Helicase conserved C-terminal domain-containing protein [Desulfoscipio geothermicus DSM 3669]|uniref:Helicase conserved C-terminal domain-containing protein n=2 Tax=Desulfoscipio geothermicus TaxID=39060 RepID=A0A1I6DED1_9FIRM|nr:Helicase conserved C-terminal domain-containing protein [Desulfoscipio geothermicus DSM 3669]